MQTIMTHAADCNGIVDTVLESVHHQNNNIQQDSTYSKLETAVNYSSGQLNTLAYLNEQTLAETAKGQDCPICGRYFPAECIAGHADICAMQLFDR